MKKQWDYITLLSTSTFFEKYKLGKLYVKKFLSSNDYITLLHLVKNYHNENSITKNQEAIIIFLLKNASPAINIEDKKMHLEILNLAARDKKYDLIQEYINHTYLLHVSFCGTYIENLISALDTNLDKELIEIIQLKAGYLPDKIEAKKIFTIFEKYGKDLSQQDEFGNTIFHYLAMCVSTIDYDIRKIFDKNIAYIQNLNGITPYFLIYEQLDEPTKPAKQERLYLCYTPPAINEFSIEMNIVSLKELLGGNSFTPIEEN